MKVLVTGVGGQLGHDVMNELTQRGHNSIGTDLQGEYQIKLDITDANDVALVIARTHPDAVIHCAAWTAVDAAETKEELVRKVNVVGTAKVSSWK